jgi:hypothetical protein
MQALLQITTDSPEIEVSWFLNAPLVYHYHHGINNEIVLTVPQPMGSGRIDDGEDSESPGGVAVCRPAQSNQGTKLVKRGCSMQTEDALHMIISSLYI